MTKSFQILAGDVCDYIRLNPKMYLPEGNGSTEEKLITLLVSDCLSLGAEKVEITRNSHWCAVSSNIDWLKSTSRHWDTIDALFGKVFPLLEAGPNSIRHEVVVKAFCSDVLTAADGNVNVIKNSGREGNIEIGRRLCDSYYPARVVAFSI